MFKTEEMFRRTASMMVGRGCFVHGDLRFYASSESVFGFNDRVTITATRFQTSQTSAIEDRDHSSTLTN